MRLALIVCGFMFGVILAPIDGRLKYGEILPTDTVDSPSVPSASSEDANENATDGEQFASALHELSATKGLRHPDEKHKYDWARYYLRHLTAGTLRDIDEDALGGFEHPNLINKPERSELNEMEDAISMNKRADYNRELSADLYSQYPSSCACQTKYELLDLGYTHFPRYIVNAICQNRNANSRKCWRGSSCKEIPYKVRVLTRRSENDSGEQDHHSTLLPEPLRDFWRFKTVTIAAACQCSI